MNNQPRQRVLQQIDLLKWGLGCTGVGMMLCTGVIMFTLIVMPVIFRNLDQEDQARIVHRIPMMGTFLPTRAFTEFLPTGDPQNSSDALALLTSQPEVTAAPVTVAALSAGGDGSDPLKVPSPATQQIAVVPTATAIIIPATATNVPTNTTAPTQVALLIPTNTNAPATVVAATVIPPTAQPSATIIPATAVPPTATTIPTEAFTPTMIPSPTTQPSATPIPAPFSFHTDQSYKWIPQTWNNCGPANLTQVLNAMGWKGTQADAASYLKPTKNDKNVSPWQLVTYVNEQIGSTLGLKAVLRYAGDLDLVKRLVSQNFGVIMETGYDVAGEGWMGHYLTVIGYDDAQSTLFGLDTYLGDGPDSLGFREDYTDLNRRWGHFNRVYIVIYPAGREGELANILGADADTTYNAQHALNVAKAEASAQPGQPYAWFNMGTSYVLLRQYRQAAVAFDQAWSVGGLPWRMLWYQFTPYEAYYNVGNYKNVLALANTSLTTTTDVEETYYWRGMAEAALGKTDLAINDLKHAVNYNRNFTSAVTMLAQIQGGTFQPPVVAQAN